MGRRVVRTLTCGLEVVSYGGFKRVDREGGY